MASQPSDINYFKIGMFVLVGIGFIIAALLVFGSSRMFMRTVYIETYFDESVQGISEGSPVKYRGLQIGYVKEMAFASEKYKKNHSAEDETQIRARSIYVKIAITSKLFTELSDEEFRKLFDREVASGLRIKLSPQGLTGTTYIDLNYVDPKENPVAKLPWQPENFYLPAAPSMLTQLADNVQYIMQDVRQINFKELFANVSSFVVAADKVTKKLSVTLGQLGELKDLKGDIKNTLQNFEATSENLKFLSEEVKLYPSQLLFGGAPPRIDLNKL